MTQQLESHPGSHSDSGKLVEDFFKVLGILKRGWRFVAIAVAICLTLAMIHVARTKPIYAASARLLVLHKGGRPVKVSGGESFDFAQESADSLTTQLMIIRSPVIVERAVASLGRRGLTADSVIPRLEITLPDPTARVLDIAYKTETKGEADRLVKAIIESYVHFLKENYQKNTNDSISLIVQARDELSLELKGLEREYLEFHKKNPSSNVDEHGRTLAARRLDQWDRTANDVRIRELLLRTKVKLGQNMAAEGLGVGPILNALSQVGGVGADEKDGTIRADAADKSGRSLSHESIAADLADVEFKRSMAERLVVHLRAELESSASARPIRDADVLRAFYADPAVAALQAELKRARARHAEVARTVRNAGDPALVSAVGRVRGFEKELAQMWQRRRPEIREELTHGAMPEGRASIRKAESDLVELKARESVLREKRDQFRSDLLRQLRGEREQLVKLHGPGHARVAQLGEQIAKIEGAADKAGDAPGDGSSQALLGSLARSLGSLEALREEIQKRFEEDRAGTQKSEVAQLAESNLRNNIERHRALFNSVVNQLKQAQLVSESGSVTAQTINPPAVVTLGPRMALILIMALVVGCGLGGGAAYVVDLMDARIRTLSELRRVLEYYVLGLVPQLPSGQGDLTGEVGLISHSLPRSAQSESYKSVRTNLEFLRRNGDVRVLLVTSASSGDGKSTTASNLAISLAHAGRKVLLIDGDLRRPSLHKIFALRRDSGLTQVLKDHHPLQRAIQPTLVENLDLLAAGPDVTNPAELLTSHRLGEALDEMRRMYDVVIFDSPPLLAVADSSILAVAADRILLVVRVAATRRHDLDRVGELLRTLGTPVIGAVINAITQGQSGYGYQYGYGTYGLPSSASDAVGNSGSGVHVALANGRHEMTE